MRGRADTCLLESHTRTPVSYLSPFYETAQLGLLLSGCLRWDVVFRENLKAMMFSGDFAGGPDQHRDRYQVRHTDAILENAI